MSTTNPTPAVTRHARPKPAIRPVHATLPPPATFTHDGKQFLFNNHPIQILSGELHYFRIPRPYWQDRLEKAKALGLNTVCTYMPWNLHEPLPGRFDFDGDGGMLDVAAFVRLAKEMGLLVIVRPGPYICAEWDFGGLPGWLLADPDCRIRCDDANYLAAVRRYIARVGEELSALTCARGGPIIMVQVENEYGSYSNDKHYLAKLRDMLKESGFDPETAGSLLFTSDGTDPEMLAAGTLDGTLAVANFGSKADHNLALLKEFRPDQPVMCGEFWCGWFDQWGKKRQGTADPAACVDDVRVMYKSGASFNFYMFHGGTNFGFTSGANVYDAFSPTVTNYDYRALLDEAGRPTPKYEQVAKVLGGPGVPETLSAAAAIPANRFRYAGSTALFDNLPAAIHDPWPRAMERYGQYLGGAILYRTNISGLGGGTLRIADAHDYAIVYLDGVRIGRLDRRLPERILELPEQGGKQLDVLVWALGRVNYGPHLLDRKGITGRVELGRLTLSGWRIFPLPMTPSDVASLAFGDDPAAGPAFHRFTINLDDSDLHDTYLDLRHGWSLGAVWVNGHNLGRFWTIGPQQTLFVPACWLKPGQNEIVVVDLEAASPGTLATLPTPVLDEVPS